MRALLLAALLLAGMAGARADDNDVVAIERGRYLATVGDCVGCHRGPQGDYAGGAPVETPFGKIVAPNLTPDRVTGIGAWDVVQFRAAMREGVGAKVGHLYPALPYPWYTRVTTADVDAIFAFLRSLPPVDHPVDRDTLPFPFDVRASMRAWNALFFKPGEFQPDPAKSAEWNRGAYLTEGLGHCGACHTAKNVLGGDRTSDHLQGGVVQGWFAPNLTADPRQGVGQWSVEDIVAYLATGASSRSRASGPMAEVVKYSTSLMTAEDLRAIAVYLKDVPAAGAPAPAAPAADDAGMRAGEAVYVDNCMACHRRDGQGVAGLIPPLANSQVVQQAGDETLLRVILGGVRGVATDAAPTAPGMPSFGWRLNDAQVADVVTYVRATWGNAAPAATPKAAGAMRQALAKLPG